MTVTFKMKVDTSGIDNLAQKTAQAEDVLAKHALAIEAGAKTNAPVLTGALRSSIIAEPRSPRLWEISDGVVYGVFQELGTSKGISAKYFLTGACESQADKFFADLQALFK